MALQSTMTREKMDRDRKRQTEKMKEKLREKIAENDMWKKRKKNKV